MKLFVSNYHISVNRPMVEDFAAIGLDVQMPNQQFGKDHISFFAPNDEHVKIASIISYEQFINTPEPMVILIPCMQMLDDFNKLYEARGKKDVLMYLTANSDAVHNYKLDAVDYLLTHDLDFHRLFNGKYKMLYFNRPTLTTERKTGDQLRASYDSKQVNLYINNFDKEGFIPEHKQAVKFKQQYEQATGTTVPFYGYDMKDGWLTMEETHQHMVDSMFTLVFKRRETWGQMVNESMLLGTPCIFLREFLYSTFTDYLITPETSVLGDTVEDLVNIITSLSFEQYETLVNEAYSQSDMYCNDKVRREKLTWFFGKVANDIKMV